MQRKQATCNLRNDDKNFELAGEWTRQRSTTKTTRKKTKVIDLTKTNTNIPENERKFTFCANQ